MLNKLRFDRLYAACAVFNPTYRDRIADVRARNPGLASSPHMALSICWIWWLRMKALAGNLTQKTIGAIRGDRVVGLTDIGEVVAYMTTRSETLLQIALRSME
jgi:hypothetical protein